MHEVTDYSTIADVARDRDLTMALDKLGRSKNNKEERCQLIKVIENCISSMRSEISTLKQESKKADNAYINMLRKDRRKEEALQKSRERDFSVNVVLLGIEHGLKSKIEECTDLGATDMEISLPFETIKIAISLVRPGKATDELMDSLHKIEFSKKKTKTS